MLHSFFIVESGVKTEAEDPLNVHCNVRALGLHT